MSKTGSAFFALQELDDAEIMAAWPVPAPVGPQQPATEVAEALPF